MPWSGYTKSNFLANARGVLIMLALNLVGKSIMHKATIYCMLVSHWGLPQEVMRAGGPLPLWHYFRSCCAVLAYERL